MNNNEIEKLYIKLSEHTEIYHLVRNYTLFKLKMAKISKKNLEALNKSIQNKKIAYIKLILGRLGISCMRFKFEDSLLGNELKKIKTKPLIEVWNNKSYV